RGDQGGGARRPLYGSRPRRGRRGRAGASHPADAPPGPEGRPRPVKRPIRPEEQKLWSMVAATVHRKPGRRAPPPEPAPAPPLVAKPQAKTAAPPPAPVWDGAPFTVGELVKGPSRAGSPLRNTGERDIEPRRKHRIAK